MREIKFRAWFSKSKQLLNVEEITWQDNGEIFVKGTIDDEISVTARVAEDRVFLMQYIGLKDKNGVEIWENDLVKDHNPHIEEGENVGRVSYEAPEFALKIDSLDEWWTIFPNSCEVIGNIYENPELLK